MKKPPCKVCRHFAEKRNELPNCGNCLPYLEKENEDIVSIFTVAIHKINYTQSGNAIGVDLNSVIELVKMKACKSPFDVIEKVMHLSNELIKSKNG